MKGQVKIPETHVEEHSENPFANGRIVVNTGDNSKKVDVVYFTEQQIDIIFRAVEQKNPQRLK